MVEDAAFSASALKKVLAPSKSSPHPIRLPLRRTPRSTLSLPSHDLLGASLSADDPTDYDDDIDFDSSDDEDYIGDFDADLRGGDVYDFGSPILKTHQLRANTATPPPCRKSLLNEQGETLGRQRAFRRRPLLESVSSTADDHLLHSLKIKKEELVREINRLRMEIEDVDEDLEDLSTSRDSAIMCDDTPSSRSPSSSSFPSSPTLPTLESTPRSEDSGTPRLLLLPSRVHSKNNRLNLGRKKFNMEPKSGLEFLTREGLVGETAADVADFLFRGEGLNKSAIGDFLGENREFNLRVLDEFLRLHEFHDMILVQALRQFLWSFRLPGEAQKIDRMMEAFAKRYCDCNPHVFSSNNVDTCYVLSFAVIMLNTSLHNPNIKESQRQTLEQFISMNKGINRGEDLPRQLIVNLYDSIKKEPFKIPLDDSDDLIFTFFNPDKEGWLLKQGGRVKNWKRRWFILNDNCLYYFEYTTDKEPRGIIPLENLQVREVNDKNKSFCFELYPANSEIEKIKACKTKPDGKLVEGRHKVYRFSASTYEERQEWMKVIRSSISQNPFLDFLVERKKSLKSPTGPPPQPTKQQRPHQPSQQQQQQQPPKQTQQRQGSTRIYPKSQSSSNLLSPTTSPPPREPTRNASSAQSIFSAFVSRLSVERT